MKRYRFGTTIASLLSASGLAALTACAVHPEKVADHRLYADDEQTIVSKTPLSFAVVGNLRPPLPMLDRAAGSKGIDGVTDAITADLRRKVDSKEIQFVVLMGDSVRASSDKEWAIFDQTWREVLDGQTVPQSEGYRVPAVPVAGDMEFRTDKALQGMEGAFPGFGADIGFNRVASWYSFTARVNDANWRFVITDTHKDRLGSRWNEQLYWIPRAAEGRYDHILFFGHDPLVTLAPDTERNLDDGPGELITTLEDNAKLFKLRAVFSAEPHTTEVLLPSGRLGTAFFGAGGGGAPAEALERWGNAKDLGFGDIQLEPSFDLKLQKEVGKRAEAEGWPETALDKARGTGSWEGFTATYDPAYMPLYGYWLVTLDGDTMNATWYAWQPNGSFLPFYTLQLDDGSWAAR